jgi:hypothetical protein
MAPGGREMDVMSRYIQDEQFSIPKGITFIDTIVLDEELQLIREEYWEEMGPIKAAWDAWLPRQSWNQPLPMCIWEPLPWHHYNHLQLAFLKHINFMGEAVSGLCNLEFQTGMEILRDRYSSKLSMEQILDSANLMWQLQADIEAVA